MKTQITVDKMQFFFVYLKLITNRLMVDKTAKVSTVFRGDSLIKNQKPLRSFVGSFTLRSLRENNKPKTAETGYKMHFFFESRVLGINKLMGNTMRKV